MTAHRFIPLITIVAALALTGEASAVKGSCDHRLEPSGTNQVVLSKGNGTVTVDVRWTWDFTSVYPDCSGPVQSIHYTNTGTETWYAHLPKKARGTTVVEIPPGADQTVTGNALRQAGLDTLSAIEGLVVDQLATASALKG